MNSITLQTSAILHVPFEKHENNFTYIINNVNYQTSYFVAELISTTITKLRLNDPTLSEFIINTKSNGDFQNFLNIINFKQNQIPQNEISFFAEIIEILRPDCLDIKIDEDEITIDNIFTKIQQNDHFSIFFSEELEKEITFLSQNLYQLKEEQWESFLSISDVIIEKIFNNPQIQLESEDQLLKIINYLYTKDKKYSKFYEYADFLNIEISTMNEFLSIFDINDTTQEIWNLLSARLRHEINIDKNEKTKRAKLIKIQKKASKTFSSKNDQNFDGIFNFLKNNSNIDDEVNITCSSIYSGCNPKTLLQYENSSNEFFTKYIEDSWICFEFKKHQIIPSDYKIRSIQCSANSCHPRTWRMEGSNDKNTWKTIDDQRNCSYLNGKNLVHTFPIEKSKQDSFKYLRFHQAGPTWRNDYCLDINCIEFYGKLI